MTGPAVRARRAVLLAGLAGQAATAAAGLLPLLVLPLTAGALVALGLLPERRRAPSPARLRRLADVGVLLLLLAAAPWLLDIGQRGAREVLGPLLVGVQAVQALTWQARRDLQTGLLVAGALLVLGASYADDVLVGPPLLLGWGAALVAGLLLQQERSVAGVDVVVAGRPAPLLRPAALAGVLGLVAFLLVPVPDGAGLRSRLAGTAAAVLPRPGAFTGDVMDLRVRGPLSDRPVALVPSDSPVLWRSAVHDTYDGATWSTGRPVRRLVSGPPFVLPPAPGPRRVDEVRLQQPTSAVFAPGEPLLVQGGPAGSGRLDERGALALPGRADGYRVTSAGQESSPARLAAARPGPADPRYLQLPAALPQRVRDLAAQLTAGAATRVDAVLAVERFLGGHATYELDPPVPAPGEDAVDRFLFVDRRGFCEHFAAAEVVLLRAAGIPARLVTGLAHGRDRGDGWRAFEERDLHAWVEVPYGPLGWAASDPTAGAARAEAAGGTLRERVAGTAARVLRAAEQVPGGRPALAAAVLVVLCAVAAPRPRRRRPPPSRVASGGPLLTAFLRADARLGPARRGPAESLAELGARLGHRSALAAVEQECYGAVPVPEDRARQAVTELDGALAQRATRR